jgi:REP element-mobilizing transposase RayT
MKADNYTHPSGLPLAFHIVFNCYGAWLQGDPRGSVSMRNNIFGEPLLPYDPIKQRNHRNRMTQPPYQLDEARRKVVMDAIKEVCTYREWHLIAAHIRSTHVHVIVSAPCRPEKVMGDFKAYASRALTRSGFESSSRRRWEVHGSTGYIWRDESLGAAVHYVVREQGEPMEVYVEEWEGEIGY